MQNPAIVIAVLFLFGQLMGTAHAAETVVTKSAWMEMMKTALPNAFCSGKGINRYFRECFKVTEDECIEEALRAVKVCFASIVDQIPEQLHQPDDGTSWGTKLGACAGRGYEISLISRRIDTADCKDATKVK